MNTFCSGPVGALALNSRMLRWSPTAFLVRHFTPLCRPSGHLCPCLCPESEKKVGHRSQYSLSLSFPGSSHRTNSMRTQWDDKIVFPSGVSMGSIWTWAKVIGATAEGWRWMSCACWHMVSCSKACSYHSSRIKFHLTKKQSQWQDTVFGQVLTSLELVIVPTNSIVCDCNWLFISIHFFRRITLVNSKPIPGSLPVPVADQLVTYVRTDVHAPSPWVHCSCS